MTAVATTNRRPRALERRSAPRQRLCLEAQAGIPGAAPATILIHELSRSGFLMETSDSARIGEPVHLRLVNAEAHAARVVWSCGRHFGCEFERPLSNATLSAALLKARPAAKQETLPPLLHFDPLGQMASAALSVASPAWMERRLVLAVCVVLWAALSALIVYAR